MAIYIGIEKVTEKNQKVLYRFSNIAGLAGEFEIDLLSSEIELVTPLKGDADEMMFIRASHKVQQHVKRGEIPVRTCWAS